MTQTVVLRVDLASFCTSCPDVQEVTAFLVHHGFHLDLELGPKRSQRLPAQYHYQDAHNTEVIYLAGRDTPEERQQRFPPHSSRWWVYPGSSLHAATQITKALATRWHLDFQRTENKTVSMDRERYV